MPAIRRARNARSIALTALLAGLALFTFVASADAHRASTRVAQYAAVEVARLVYLEVPEAVDYGRGSCKRTSSQRVWCWSYNDLVLEDLSQAECWWRTATYRNRRSGRYRVRALAETVDCFETVPAPDDCLDYGICKRGTAARRSVRGYARPSAHRRQLPGIERRFERLHAIAGFSGGR